MTFTFAHVCIRVRDLAITEAFYTGVLGFEKRFEFKRDGQLFGFYFALGERTFLEVFRAEDPAMGTAIAHLCLECADIDTARDVLAGHGVEATEKKLGCDGSWQIWIKDPDGIPIEIHQYTDASAQLHPHDVIVNW